MGKIIIAFLLTISTIFLPNSSGSDGNAMAEKKYSNLESQTNVDITYTNSELIESSDITPTSDKADLNKITYANSELIENDDITPTSDKADLNTDITLDNILSSYSGKESYFAQLNGTEITNKQLEEIKYSIIKYVEENSKQSLDKLSDFEKLCYSMRWIKGNIKYTTELEDNLAYSVFISQRAVCQGYANLFKVFAHIFNIPCLVINGDTYFGAHAWNCFFDKTDKKWYICDPTNTGADDFEKVKDSNTQNNYRASFIPYAVSPYLYQDDNFTYWYIYNDELKVQGITVEVRENVESVSVPECVLGYPNLKIEYLLLPINKISNTNKLKSIKIPKSIKNIENSYFSNFYELEEIELGNNDNYMQIGDMICSNDYSQIFVPRKIKEIVYPGIKEIGKNSNISNLENLNTVRFSMGTESIGTSAIENCPNLKTIYIPKSVKIINDDAFIKVNENLTIVSDNENVKTFAEKNGYGFNYETNDGKDSEKENDTSSEQGDKISPLKNINRVIVAIIYALIVLIFYKI